MIFFVRFYAFYKKSPLKRKLAKIIVKHNNLIIVTVLWMFNERLRRSILSASKVAEFPAGKKPAKWLVLPILLFNKRICEGFFGQNCVVWQRQYKVQFSICSVTRKKSFILPFYCLRFSIVYLIYKKKLPRNWRLWVRQVLKKEKLRIFSYGWDVIYLRGQKSRLCY